MAGDNAVTLFINKRFSFRRYLFLCQQVDLANVLLAELMVFPAIEADCCRIGINHHTIFRIYDQHHGMLVLKQAPVASFALTKRILRHVTSLPGFQHRNSIRKVIGQSFQQLGLLSIKAIRNSRIDRQCAKSLVDVF